MRVYQLKSGKWRAGFELKGWDRKRPTFNTEALAREHMLASAALHAAGKPYQPPTHTNVVATKAEDTIGELVKFVDKLQWSKQASAKREHAPSHKHPQLRYAEMFANWVGPNTRCS